MSPRRFENGRRLPAWAAAAAVAGLGLTAAGAALDTRRALFSYLTAFTFWLGIAVGALILLMAFHASSARWPVVLRRVLEAIPLSIPLFLILFVPIALGVKDLFGWVDPMQEVNEEARRLWVLRHPWLNVPFFLVRAGFYFLCWIVVGQLLFAWSVRQDQEGGARLTIMQRRLGAGGLPLVALTITFAAFDWLMSLAPFFASTIFGVYFFAGAFLAAIGALIVCVLAVRSAGFLGDAVGPNHLHSLGKFLFAFVVFWAYIAYSQYMLTWIANLPSEVPYYLVRERGRWRPVGAFLVVFHFLAPFFILLSRDLKRRARPLAVMAIWILIAHYVDVYWMVMPHLDPQGPRPSWTDLTALVGIGAAALGFTAWRLRGRHAMPVGDPYLHDSLRYEPR